MNNKKTLEEKLIIAGAIFAVIFTGAMVFTRYFVKTVVTQKILTTTKAYQPQSLPIPTPTPNLTNIDTSSVPKAEYRLLNGWNFIAFPIKPLNFKNASGLMLDIKNKGGYATVVARWDGDRWQEYVQRGEEIFGDNFPISPGEGYFVRNHKTIDWVIVGEEVTQDDLNPYSLKTGWNAVGLIGQAKKAEDILDSIDQGEEVATEIDWWDSGSWALFVKRIYSPENIKSYGTNFSIQDNQGYMIKINQDSTWENK
jgi:hypothetical protein